MHGSPNTLQQAGSSSSYHSAAIPGLVVDTAVAVVYPMSLSKSDMGAMRQAMAWKVKYRKRQSDGTWRVRVSWDLCGVHPDNRGKTYCTGARVKDLGISILEMGCSMEEADHMGVAVEEKPQSRRLEEYNKKEVKGNQDLEACFPVGLPVLFAFLNHTHLGLVVKAWRGSAPWNSAPINLPDGTELHLCDENGLLTFKAVEQHENGKEFGELSNKGALVEVLGSEIEVEEPSACNIISRAMNMKQEVALEQTELQAWEALTMEITLQANASQGAKICFESVKAAVAGELDVLLEDPDLIEMFDLIISLGSHKQTYLQEIRDWGSRFVNQKKRRMRLNGFKVLNDMPLKYPRAKVAVFKLTYKGIPTLGYVKSPDVWWTKVKHELLDKLEQALHYFHITCKASVEALPSEFDRSAFLGSVDVSLAQAFRNFAKEEEVEDVLAQTAAKWRKTLLTQLGDPAAVANGAWKHAPVEGAAWLKDKCTPAVELPSKQQDAPKEETPIFARLIEFNEETGQLLNEQVVVPKKDKEVEQQITWELPWQDWMRTDLARSRGKHDRAKSNAFAVMQLVFQHECGSSHDVIVQCVQGGARVGTRLLASKDLEPGALALVPYVSGIEYISADKKHLLDPDRLTVKVTCHQAPAGELDSQESRDDASVETKARARQDVKALLNKNAAAVAASSSKAARKEEVEFLWLLKDSKMPNWEEQPNAKDPQSGHWSFHAKCNPHPYWMVPRLTPKEADARRQPVNCHIRSRAFTSIQLGGLYGNSLSSTFEVDLPEITNTVHVAKGEQLVLGKTVAQPKPEKDNTYKDVSKRKSVAVNCSSARAKNKAAKPDSSAVEVL